MDIRPKPSNYNIQQRLGDLFFKLTGDPYPINRWGVVAGLPSTDETYYKVLVGGNSEDCELSATIIPALSGINLGDHVLVQQTSINECIIISTAQEPALYHKDYLTMVGLYDGEPLYNVLNAGQYGGSVELALADLPYSEYYRIHPMDYTYINGVKFMVYGFDKDGYICLSTTDPVIRQNGKYFANNKEFHVPRSWRSSANSVQKFPRKEKSKNEFKLIDEQYFKFDSIIIKIGKGKHGEDKEQSS